MRRKTWGRVIAMALSAIMMLACFAGCGDDKVTIDGTPTIKMYIPSLNIANAQCIVEEINKQAGINLEIVESGGSQEAAQRAALIITTGEKVNWVNLSDSQPYKEWGESGFLNDLTPYLEKYKDEVPTLYMLANDPMFKAMKGDNGETYVIPCINYVTNLGIRINKEWLETANNGKVPETTEEVYEMLKNFKDKKVVAADDSAFIASGVSSFRWAMLAYGGQYLTSTDYPMFYENEKGEFEDYLLSDMNKEALKYVRKLYSEGLINKDWRTIGTTTQENDRFIAGKAGMWYRSAGCDEQMWDAIKTTTVWPPAPKGPTGVQSYGGFAPQWRVACIPAAITDEAEILATLKFMEWMHSPEARMLCAFGIEGRHYAYNDKGEIYYDTEEYMTNRDNDYARVNGGGSPFEWGIVSPFKGAIDATKYDTAYEAVANIELFPVKAKEPVDENYMGYVANINKYINPYPYAAYISDELKQAAVGSNEVMTNFYADCIEKPNFDIDAEWPKFVEEYNKAGGTKALEVFNGMIKKYGKVELD